MISNTEQPKQFLQSGQLQTVNYPRSVTVWSFDGHTLGWIQYDDIVISLNRCTSSYVFVLTRFGAGWVRMDRLTKIK